MVSIKERLGDACTCRRGFTDRNVQYFLCGEVILGCCWVEVTPYVSRGRGYERVIEGHVESVDSRLSRSKLDEQVELLLVEQSMDVEQEMSVVGVVDDVDVLEVSAITS